MTDLVIGDDHTLFGEALAKVLSAHALDVQAVANTLPGVLDAVRAHQPEVCLLDRHFVEGDAVEMIPEIISSSAGTRVMILTADADVSGVMRALQFGAQGYVHKASGFRVLLDAIGRIMDDDSVVVEIPGQQASRPSPELADARRLYASLTARERECLGLIAEGLGTRAMARRLGVSDTTARTHSQRLLSKLGVHSRLEAASFAVRYSLLDTRPAGGPAPPYARRA
ncbi:LuxR C-terminal-related transcriptional regulator [Pseudonocardia acidicola]|uniref:Response regulator transcription factor n=1 Tax=Pseudonocardia acidicola TaxID=2724939 RepID=A0ABX1SEJ1_9PSEU|nr:response regulator transcription factor [Pseudonocardia acidicola]NMH99984.1 response regulator transcription factor [Pseudonocardia acidicola]